MSGPSGVRERALGLSLAEAESFGKVPASAEELGLLWRMLRDADVHRPAAQGASDLWDDLAERLEGLSVPRGQRWRVCAHAGRAWLLEFADAEGIELPIRDRAVLGGEWDRVTAGAG